VSLHWTVYLARDGGERRHRTKTRDISPGGFYCVLNQFVQLGEQLECDIVVPVHSLRNPEEAIYLRCRVQAVRVEKMPTGADFGVACRIEDYRVVRGPGDGT